jgi:hypothetical protein
MLAPFRFFTHFYTKQKILSRKFQQFLHQKKNHIREVQICVCVCDQKTLLEAEIEKACCFGYEVKREKLACFGRGIKDCKQAGMEKLASFGCKIKRFAS